MSLEKILGEFGSALLGLVSGGFSIAFVLELLNYVSEVL